MLAQRAVWEDPRWTRAVEDRLGRPHYIEVSSSLLCGGRGSSGFTQSALSVSRFGAAVGRGNERAWRKRAQCGKLEGFRLLSLWRIRQLCDDSAQAGDDALHSFVLNEIGACRRSNDRPDNGRGRCRSPSPPGITPHRAPPSEENSACCRNDPTSCRTRNPFSTLLTKAMKFPVGLLLCDLCGGNCRVE